MADSALFLLWASFVAAICAASTSIVYAAQPWFAAVLSSQRVVATEPGVAAPPLRIQRSATLGGMATLSVWVAALVGLAGLVMRSIALQHAPYSNLFEFSMSFGIAIVLIYAIFEYRSGTRLAGAFVLPVACGLYASALAFPSEGQEVLVPALQSTRSTTPRSAQRWPQAQTVNHGP